MVTLRNNPALHEEPLSQPARIIPLSANESLFNWIESTGRFKMYDPVELPVDEVTEELEEIMGASVYGVDKEDDAEDWDLEA